MPRLKDGVMNRVKVLKIGGSILTDKNRSYRAKKKEIKRVAEEVAQSSEALILVHGAGSFGHVIAKEHRLTERFNPEGLRATHQSVKKLNELVVQALSEAGADPMPIHPFSCMVLKDGKIESFALEPIVEMVERGLMPVLHGDVAMDITRGSGIVSGDQLVTYLAKTMTAKIVAIGTNVDGVIFQGKILPKISMKDLPSIDIELGGSSEIDVTGGMRGKLLELLDLADAGIESVIFNACHKGQIIKALEGESVGTIVRRAA
jgi:isopentenyl phosphate kinase